jgi:transposase
MKNQQANGATPRRYDEAFKREVIRLWKSSGRSAEATARDLGISVFQLYDWSRTGQPARAAGVAVLSESKESLQAENERLRTELAWITEQRDILKKAAGILSEASPSGMPRSNR